MIRPFFAVLQNKFKKLIFAFKTVGSVFNTHFTPNYKEIKEVRGAVVAEQSRVLHSTAWEVHSLNPALGEFFLVLNLSFFCDQKDGPHKNTLRNNVKEV